MHSTLPITRSKVVETFGTLRKVADHYQSSYPSAAVRFLKLYCLDGYTREEIFCLGIADPRLSGAEMAKLLSTKRAHRLQSQINPKNYAYVTEDKAIFNQFCIGASIRTPRLHAIVDPSQIWTPDGKHLGRGAGWERFLLEDLPARFVAKPTSGVLRESVYLLSREGDSFVEDSGTTYSAHELLRALMEDPAYDRFIVEQRVENHASLAELSGTPALQTTRVITGVDDAGEPAILMAFQRLVSGANVVDNFRRGRLGNLVAELSLEDGTMVQAVTGHESGLGLKAMEDHPTTGKRLIGFKMPYWQELREMVVEGARKLMPIRTIGWDIAVAPDGPFVIEANFGWSPEHANAVRRSDRLLDYCRRVKRKTKPRRVF